MMDFDTYALLFIPFWAMGLPFLLVGVLTGIIGAANAWVGDFETAQRLGWNCAVPGGIVGSLLLAASAAIGVPYPWIFALPALLGGMALLHAHYFRDMPPPT
ncbi:hypothetical protein LOC68_15745 [Blastopirellula sp. JC732]|uniref:Uncharacterized protein n=1 Tax=Blastopirellula sediminis TaxID=2894196 RepID=A0A9X1MMG8_9BACT|nr:hypothetical protein [Blastopirellula sediminis]MCC9606861.1 hypothetical protein [Blastopirellula sediminis]MCC9629843.1 hypothetical protein [Blastopirellula sediminis]